MDANHAAARCFDEIADLLEIQGEDFFKIRAYRRAAQVLANFPEDAAQLRREDRLDAIPGIGRALAQKIEEILDAGSCALLERLRREVPVGLLDVMRIPGVGGKTAGRLYRDLGIDGLDSLEEAARAGRLRTLPGMGPKTEQNVLEGIAGVRRRSERALLGDVRPTALALCDAVRALSGVERAELAGSLRRWRETVKDVDLLAAARDPVPVLEAFTRLPAVRRVTGVGDAKAGVVLAAGIAADLRVVEPKAYWTALHHFTGSAEHHVQLRHRARERGLKLNEYGCFDAADNRLPVDSEEALYALLDLGYIPPELREGTGEVEAAAEGRLPELVSLQDIRGDLHVHTDWTDGVDSLDAMVTAAAGRGYAYVAICDHSKALAMARGLDVARLAAQRAAIDALNERLGGRPRVLAGIEVDILPDGDLDLPDDALAGLDVVVASVHSAFRQDRETMTRRVIRACEHPHVDVIGHPTGRKLGQRDPYDVDVDALVAAAARTQTALEINANPDRLDLRDVAAREAARRGVLLAINTDAHAVGNFGLMEYGVATARRAWLEAGQVLNTRPADDLLDWLAHHKR